jgi:hypothetical protein
MAFILCFDPPFLPPSIIGTSFTSAPKQDQTTNTHVSDDPFKGVNESNAFYLQVGILILGELNKPVIFIIIKVGGTITKV